jgi:hypothetical protein
MSTIDSQSLPLIDPSALVQPEANAPEKEKQNTPCQSKLVKAFEIVRTIGTILASLTGKKGDSTGYGSTYRLSAGLIVFFSAGVSGLELLVLPDISARDKNFVTGSPYQIYCGLNYIALAVVMIILLSIHASDAAVATLMLVATITMALLYIDFLVMAIKGKKAGKEVGKVFYVRLLLLPIPIVAVSKILSNWKPFHE